MRNFTVEWLIELDAEDAVDAARQALAIHRDPDSIATVFTVTDNAGGVSVEIDLEEVTE